MYQGHDLRERLLEDDPGLNQTLISEGTSISQLYTQDKWERHRSVHRYTRHFKSLLGSTVFQRIFRPLSYVMLMAFFTSLYNGVVRAQTWGALLPALAVAPIGHQLVGAALSLLLVFRTNGSFGRFLEGRLLWGQLVRTCRDLARCSRYCAECDALRKELCGWAAAFPVFLKYHLRSGRSRANTKDPTAFKDDPRKMFDELEKLGLSRETLEEAASSPNPPFHCQLRLSATLHNALAKGDLNPSLHRDIERWVSELGTIAGGCERLLSTPIPLSYTRHTSRSLLLWLLSLPIALWDPLGWAVLPVCCLIAYITLGIDEIGMEIEEPFCILPLKPLTDACLASVKAAMADHAREPLPKVPDWRRGGSRDMGPTPSEDSTAASASQPNSTAG